MRYNSKMVRIIFLLSLGFAQNQVGKTYLDFDGIDDYVIVENASPAAPANNTSRSAFAWIKAGAGNGNVFSWGERSNNKRWSILLAGGGGGIGLIGENNDVKFYGSVALDTWVYVGATFDGSTLTLYIDGAVVRSQSMTSNNYATSANTPILIGKLPYGASSGEYFKGGIDEMAIWNNALTTAEVTALYNSGSSLDASSNSGDYVSSSNLVGYWKFNEGTGITTNDASGTNNGDINGASWVPDITPPTITNVTLASKNSYADVTFSKAVYSTNGGSGALEVSDLELLFIQNNGDATNATISSIKQTDNTDANSASALIGGEQTIRVFLTITGCPSGVEQIRFQAEANSIYDSSGNVMATGVPSSPATLNTSCPPFINLTTIASDNSTISVTWSELVYNTNAGNGDLEASDFSLSISGGVATVAATPSSIVINGRVYTLGLNLTGAPSGEETLTVVPSSATAIYDATADAASTTQTNNSVKLNDQLSPTITNTTIASNNSTITVTWSEAVFGSTGSTGDVEASDFILSLAGGVATLGSTTPTSIDINGTNVTLGLSISSTPNGTEVLTVNPVNNSSIYDGSNNAAANNQSNNTVTLNDQSPPTIVITAAEGVDGFTSRDATLSLTFTINEATTNFIEADISVSNGTLSAFRSVSNTVYTSTLTPNGHGEVTIDVAQSTFTDNNGNNNTAAEQFNWFYDIQGPTITFNPANGSTGVALNSDITIEFSEPIRHLDNGEITDTNVDDLIRLKTPIHSGTDIPFDATITNTEFLNVNFNSLPISYGYSGRTITFNTVSLNGGDNIISVNPGASISISVDGTYTHTSGFCPGCVVQVYARMNDVFNLCFNLGTTDGGGSFSNTTTFTAPTTPGTYYVNPTGSLLFSCSTSESVSTSFDGETLATIVVRSVGSVSKTIITVDPSNDFDYAQTIWVGIGESVEDTINNAISSAASSFTTTDTNRAPVLHTIGNQTTFEDVAKGLVLYASDADGEGFTFSASSSDANVTVTISDSLLTMAPGLNWHGATNITVTATDTGPNNLTDAETFTLTVRPVNDAPTAITLSPDSVNENQSTSILVGRFTSADVDTGESFTYHLISGDGVNDGDNDKFVISNDSLLTNSVFDYETNDTLYIRVLTQDIGGLPHTENLLVKVIDSPDPMIAFSSATLMFGDVIVTRTNKKPMTINSTGTDTVVIDSVTVTGKGFALTDRTYPVKVAPGLSTDFEFSFSPDTLGQFTGSALFHVEHVLGLKQLQLEGVGVNDTIPPVITHTMTPINSDENQNVTITVPVTDENQITDVKLYYRLGGDPTTYDQSGTSNGDGTYSATINGSNIGINGLAYYHTATDEYNNIRMGDTLSVKVQYGKNILSSSRSGSAYPIGIPKSKWRLISIPTHLDLSTINETLADELDKEAGEYTWRIYEDRGNANWLEAQDIKIGKGYWLQQRIKDNLNFSVGSGKSVDLRNHTIRIPVGWSLIGNPYPFSINIDVDKTKLYGPLTYGKSGLEGWDGEITILFPWGGYAVYNRTGDSLNIALNALHQSTSEKSDDKMEDGWQIVIGVDNGEYGDLYNVIGRKSDALDQFDDWDKPEPPKLERYIALEMDRPMWGLETPLTTDIRSLGKLDDTWDMKVSTKGIKGPLTLTTKLIGNLDEGLSAALFDPLERRSYSLSGEDKIELKRISDNYDYPITVLVGSPEYIGTIMEELISQLPETFSLGQNYPNPFNPTTQIPFTVPIPAHIQISIYNLLGQKVATLANRWYDMGQFHVKWDGRDLHGNPLGSGMYFYSLESTDFRQAKKLIILK